MAVQRARDAWTLTCADKSCLCSLFLLPFLLPFLIMGIPFCCFCGLPCQIRYNYKLLWDMLDDAEDDAYVIGTTGGFLSVNSP